MKHPRLSAAQPVPARPPRALLAPTRLARALAASLGLGLPLAAAAQGGAPGVAQLPAVTVSAEGVDESLQHLQTPVSSGALGARTQLETPFSTAAVTRNDLQERQVTRLGEVFSTDASVSDTGGGYTAWATYLSVRGLPLDWQNSFRINGDPFLSYSTTMPYEHLEQVELLKGATGFMYGFGSPGGVVNYITKKPTDEPLRQIELGYGSDSLVREHVDIGGRAGQDDRYGYRLNATHEEGGTPNDGSLYRTAVSLALDTRLTDRLTWDFQTIYQDRKAIRQEPSIILAPNVTSLPSVPHAEDGELVGRGPFLENALRYYGTGLKYQLSSDWTASARFSHSSTRTRRNEEILTLTDSVGNYADSRSDYGEEYQFNHGQVMAEGRAVTGPLEHQIVIGASWQKQRNYYSANWAYESVGGGSLWTPNEGTYYSPGTFSGMGMYRSVDITQKAVFASDTVKLSERWSVLGGLRYTQFRQNNYDAATGGIASVYDKKPLSPTVALMVKLDPQTMAYASYVESMEPGSIVGTIYANRGEVLSPIKSKQYEVGIKTERGDWAASAALFRIERGSEYARGNEWTQDGESVYQGLELGASTRLASDWTVGGSLMLLDTEYREGEINIGNRVVGTPRAIATAQVVYRVPYVPGLKLRAAAKYTGKMPVRADNNAEVKGYTVVDLGASYDTRLSGYDTTFRLMVNNVTNKRYWAYQFDNYIKPGETRSVMLTAAVKF